MHNTTRNSVNRTIMAYFTPQNVKRHQNWVWYLILQDKIEPVTPIRTINYGVPTHQMWFQAENRRYQIAFSLGTYYIYTYLRYCTKQAYY